MTNPVNYTLQVPYDDLMEAVETFLINKNYLNEDEALLYVDMGIEVNDEGMASLDVEVINIEDEPEPGQLVLVA